MPNRIHVHLRDIAGWVSLRGAHAWGGAFWRGETEHPLDLAETFAAAGSAEEFLSAVKRLNGFFALVRENGYEVYAAVDHTRGYPLFYGRKDGMAYLSDDAYWVREKVGDAEFDETAEAEFALTGYVTGPDTLYPNVKQLQAGEALILRPGPGDVRVEPHRYFRRLYGNPFDADAAQISRMHEEVMEQVMRRVMNWAQGRLLCLPLSGGYDSRLIAVMLKRLGCTNVLAFTYGKPGNKQARVSKDVAEKLGIPWHFVPYSNEQWYRWWRTPERKVYWNYADGLSAVPHPQDWPAVWELKKAGAIPEDAVFIPGHAGTRLRSRFLVYETGRSGEDQYVTEIWKSHYDRLAPWDPVKSGQGPIMRRRVLDCGEAEKIENLQDLEQAVEKWIWQERNAKFIVNSVRVYEFWGYRWWLPLMDVELLDFWNRVPVEFRSGTRVLYEEMIEALYGQQPGVTPEAAAEVVYPAAWPLRMWIRRRSPIWRRLYDSVRKLVNKYGEYDSHSLAWYGVMNRRQFRHLYAGRNTIYYYLMLDRLGRVRFV